MEEVQNNPDSTTIGLPSKYIAALEERMQLATQLTVAMRGLRAATDTLESVTSDLTLCRQEVITLSAQLEAVQANRAIEEQLNLQNKELERQVVALKAQGATVVGVTGESTAVRRSFSRLDGGQAPQLATLSKRQKLATDGIDADIPPSHEKLTLDARNSFGGRSTDNPTLRQSLALLAADTSSTSRIDDHVVKTGSGTLRVIQCMYCSQSIGGDHRARWVKHVGTCIFAPESVRFLFSLDLIPNSEVAGKSETANETISAGGAREADNHVVITEAWDPNDRIIDQHVLKQGVGASRVVLCGYCSERIRSKERKMRTRHEVACPTVPESVRDMLGGLSNVATHVAVDAELETHSEKRHSMSDLKSTPSSGTLANDECTPQPKKAPDSASKAPVETVSVTDLPPLRPYPTEPQKKLSDGSENKLRFRAWMDIVRYQIPGHVIVNATGLKMTTFKKMYTFKEVRIVPETSTSKFSNGCYAIPEYLQQAFMAHFKGDPRYVIVSEKHQTAFAGVPVKITSPSTPSTRAVNAQPVGTENNLAAAAAESKDRPRNASEDTEKRRGSVGKLQGTRYVSIIRGIMPEFPNLPDESRKAVKRGVRLFLEAELGP
ncbi:hypothetical protein HDU81_007474, partial [Chytriomyces hyalinus]